MHTKTIKLIACFLICSSLGNAEPRRRWRTTLHKTSVVALSVANAIDIGSSWGGRETTPFLRSADGRFGARGTGIKLGMLIGIVTTEAILVRKHRNADVYATTLNLSLAAAMTKISMNNIAIKRGGN